jgi:hypothetical protein
MVKATSLYWLLSKKVKGEWVVAHCIQHEGSNDVTPQRFLKWARVHAFNGGESREWEVSAVEMNVPEMSVREQLAFVIGEMFKRYDERKVVYAIKVTKE